ncbi:transcriptional regulator [Kineobactrum sediminis]|uniref:Transcriptional regulator n=1 Tax=Kineobactrum sediminis TaxID=1905677 RepID=A0A2N5XZD3_9GAMM|nr:helix-turn-helix transcriptional regulator [Kineobactrum sediminis]PLW81502.1 transcriptional regulator [Kineobactrum sediminis]
MTMPRTYTRYAREAVTLLGEQIRLGRKQRRWTEKNLAERAGISRATLQKIENGDMGCAVGLVFEVAALVGVTLFDHDTPALARHTDHTRDKIALLPQRIKTGGEAVFDDF